MSTRMTIAVIGPSDRTRRITELETLLRELRHHPTDTDAYRGELRSVEHELRSLLDPTQNEAAA